MLAVGRAASLMIEEVRRQFKEYGLLSKNPTRPPDYSQCVAISTKASLIEMIIPGVLAICSPLVCGFLLGREALGGMLIGALVSGFMLAIFMANAGGAWDNAKKWIEASGLGSDKAKGTKYHHATIVGDTIGDPFKDTSGPSLDILIKLMTMMSILFAPIYPQQAFDEEWWWVGFIIFIVFFVIAGGLWGWMRHTGFGKIDYKTVNTIDREDGDDEEQLELVPNKGDGGHSGTYQDSAQEIESLRRQLNEAQETIAKLKNQQS